MIRRVALAAFSCLALACPAVVIAAAPARPYLAAHAAWGTYSMTDVNAELNAVNVEIAPFRLDEINDGASFGAELGVKLPTDFTIGVAYDRITGSSSVGDPTGSITYDVPANVFRLTAARSFAAGGKVRPRVGGSFGVVSEAGTIRIAASGVGEAAGDIRGTSAMGELFGGLEVAASPQIDLTLDAGYRRAKAGGITVEGTAIQNAAGDPYSVDFSGLFLRAGLRLALAR